MFGRNRILFLSAGLFAALAACHQAKPASTIPTANDETAQVEPAADPSSRELLGAAPDAKPAPHRLITKPAAKPLAQPLPATEMDPDDPMRQFDLP